MPLDPVLAERMRQNRAHLARGVRDRLLARLRRPATSAAGRTAEAAGTTARPGAAAGDAARPSGRPAAPRPRATPRERQRRAARAWDERELRTVGVKGPDVEIAELTVAADGLPDARVRLYRPAGVDRPLPVALYFFGGSFRVGGADWPTNDAAMRRRAADAGVVMAAVDYALAPEHRYPTAVRQGVAALDHLVRNAAELGIDPGAVALTGASAGGNLAAAVALANRDGAGHAVALQVLEVPVLDLTGRGIDLRPAARLLIPLPFLVRELVGVARTYLGDRALAAEPLASPLRAPSLAGMPPAVVLTAEYDPLRLHGERYAARLRADGVDASAARYLGATHDVAVFSRVVPAAARWHDDVVAALRGLHGGR